MSKIIAVDNFKKQNWDVSYENLSPYYADLQIGFTEEAPIVHFNNLKFGFKLASNDQVIDEQTYPPKGVKYIRSDQKYIISHRLKFKPETEYELFLWAENASVQIEKVETFTTPKPQQPYDSWIWDGEKWQPPVPYPDDGLFYVWNEDEETWQEYSEEID